MPQQPFDPRRFRREFGISPHEPVYFSVGASGGINARFQLSFKFRPVGPSDDRVAGSGFWQDFYLAYTQTSLWDLHSLSKPFTDSSYRPAVFYHRYDTPAELDLLTQLWPLVNDRLNFFTPTKKPIGYGTDKLGRRKRLYDQPRSPYRRLLEAGVLSPAQEHELAAYRATLEEDAELLKIFERTYGPIKRDPLAAFRPVQKRERPDFDAQQWEILPEYLLVDGYNIIFAWDELNALAKDSLEAARHKLMDILCNYQGYQKCVLILVFDAYRVPGSPGAIEQ